MYRSHKISMLEKNITHVPNLVTLPKHNKLTGHQVTNNTTCTADSSFIFKFKALTRRVCSINSTNQKVVLYMYYLGIAMISLLPFLKSTNDQWM